MIKKINKEQKLFYKNVRKLFPKKIGNNKSANLFNFGLNALRKESQKSNAPWVYTKQYKNTLKNNKIFNKIPERGLPSKKVISAAVKKFFNGIPNWRNPELQYNICAPVNITSQALMCLAQEMNIHNINNDFAGNCLQAEQIISEMMADLIDIKRNKVKSLFSFGGTASNMYAMKLAINKAITNAGKIGIPSNIYIFIASNAHFSHKTVGDWLGIGVDRLITIDSDNEGRSMVSDAENKARKIIENRGVIAGFFLNGGPFYNFTIDNVSEFVKLRSKLIKEYNLEYIPHIHVDSVIGWIWLMFNKYDFKKNPLKISQKAREVFVIRTI